MAASSKMESVGWPAEIFAALKDYGVRQVAYVPDAGHTELLRRVHADPEMTPVLLTTEEEGIGVVAGAWLGGQRAVLVMQSSGVGNCVNMLSLIRHCRFPMLMLITMRGEWEEFNPWQVPMGSAARDAFTMARQAGHGGNDFSSIVDWFCALVGAKRPRLARKA